MVYGTRDDFQRAHAVDKTTLKGVTSGDLCLEYSNRSCTAPLIWILVKQCYKSTGKGLLCVSRLLCKPITLQCVQVSDECIA